MRGLQTKPNEHRCNRVSGKQQLRRTQHRNSPTLNLNKKKSQRIEHIEQGGTQSTGRCCSLTRQVAVQALQVRAILVVAPGQRVPNDVGHPLHQLPAGVAVAFVELQRVHAALDQRVELGVERLDDVQLDVGQPQRHLVEVQVHVAAGRGRGRRRRVGHVDGRRPHAGHRVLDGAGHQGQQQQVRFAFLQLAAEHGQHGGYVAHREQVGVLFEHFQGHGRLSSVAFGETFLFPRHKSRAFAVRRKATAEKQTETFGSHSTAVDSSVSSVPVARVVARVVVVAVR